MDKESDPGTDFDTVVLCDTPKPSMINQGPSIQPILDSNEIVKIEIDHHLEADSEYFGDEAYRLVDEASSSCELIGLIALKLCHRTDLIEKYHITDLLSRNLVLAILTGIIGDSKMGKYLKTKREQRFYRIFSSMFNDLLANQTTKAGNFSNQDEVFKELGRLSAAEEKCHRAFLDKRRSSDHIGFVILDAETTLALYDEYDHDTIVSASRSISDVLAEESGFLSLVVFYDHPTISNYVQFKMRRSQAFKRYDLREIIKLFSIRNGGGHEGAVGFRIPSPEIEDVEQFALKLVNRTEEVIAALVD
jgi:nanoRNase/pAp phosphatase (c-di-AMP/oligoRNAs hydrolase)